MQINDLQLVREMKVKSSKRPFAFKSIFSIAL